MGTFFLPPGTALFAIKLLIVLVQRAPIPTTLSCPSTIALSSRLSTIFFPALMLLGTTLVWVGWSHKGTLIQISYFFPSQISGPDWLHRCLARLVGGCQPLEPHPSSCASRIMPQHALVQSRSLGLCHHLVNLLSAPCQPLANPLSTPCPPVVTPCQPILSALPTP